MTNPCLLNNVEHKDLKVNTHPGVSEHQRVNRTVIHTTEINELHKEFPIVISQHAESKKLEMHAILGLQKNQNLFLRGSSWRTRYIPASIARGPFSLGINANAETNQEPVICIDETDIRVNEVTGEPLFLKFGGESPYLQFVKKALNTIHSGLQYDATLFSLIEKYNLLTPLSVEIKLSDEEQVNISQYYSIDTKTLSALSGDALTELNQYGVLSLLYFLVSSIGNFQHLIQLQNNPDK